MTAPAAPQVCSRCDAPVAPEDLVQGLAILLDGAPVCPMCIELLPVATRLEINQVRASKGLAVTAYQMPHPRHPRLTLYTFSTANMLTVHRRTLRQSGRYQVKSLGEQSWTTVVERLIAGHSRLLFATGMTVAVGVVGALAWTAVGGSSKASSPPTEAAAVVPPPAVVAPMAVPAPVPVPVPPASLQRRDLPADPDLAWTQAAGDSRATPALMDQIAREWAIRRESELNRMELDLTRDPPAAVNRRYAALPSLPEHPDLVRVRSLHQALAERIHDRLATTATPVPIPAPVVVSAPPAVSTPVPPVLTAAPAMAVSPAAPALPSPAVVPASVVPLTWEGNATAGGKDATMASLQDPGEQPIPSPWPLVLAADATQDFLRSDEETKATLPGWKGRQAVHLTVRSEAVEGGGLVLALHPGPRLAKRELLVVVDPGRQTLPLTTLDGGWQAVALPIPATSGPALTLHLADADPAKTLGKGSFWIGPAVAVAHRPPTVADLGLTAAALPWDLVIRDTRPREALVQLITKALQSRGVTNWQAPGAFNPRAIKVLCGKMTREFTTELRRVLPRPADIGTLANGTVDDFTLDPMWWTNQQLTASRPQVESREFQVLCLIPNGEEADLPAERWGRQVRELLTQVAVGAGKSTRRAGFLPVLVLGSVDEPAYVPGNWAKAREEADRLGVPVIDLTTIPHDGLARKAWHARAAQTIAHSLANLAYQIRWRQGKK